MTSWKNNSLRFGALLPAIVFLLGLALTTAIAIWMHRDITQEAQAEFARVSDRAAAEVVTRFRRPIYGLSGAKGLYAASQTVERSEFRAYVESRELATEFPGVRGMGFIQRVAREDLETFLWYERLDGVPDFTVKQLYQRQGRIKLKAANPTFPDIVPKEGQTIEIWGVVTSSIKQFPV